MTLWADFLNHQGRKMQKWDCYFPVYERHLPRFQNQSVTMLEIGVNKGGSLELWKRFLGPNATIVGVDINPDCMDFEEDQIKVRIGDQSDDGFLQELNAEFGPFDIILDDGSHINSHQIATFNKLYPTMPKNGVYMVEDVHTSYVDRYEGGLKRPGTFIEFCKDKIDELYAFSIHKFPPTLFTRSTRSIHIYDSIVVFERGTHARPISVRVGREEF